MKNKKLKISAVAAGAVVLAGAAFAVPSLAATRHNAHAASAPTSTAAPTFGAPGAPNFRGHKGAPAFNGVQASVAATVTGVPATVTDAEVAEHGAAFIAYDFTGTAPTTQPTTGGHPVHFEATTLANGVATGTIDLFASKTAGTYTEAVYSSKTDANPVIVTIVVDSAGKATATASGSLISAYNATLKAPAFGGPNGGPGFGFGPNGFGPRGGHGDHDGDSPKGGSGWTAPTSGSTATPAPTNG